MEGETLDNAVDPDVTSHAVDFTWRFFCLVLVLLLQGGFASYEVGAIRETSTQHILLKNIGDATVSLVAWYLLGYGFAFGEDAGHIIGTSFFVFTESPFAATSGNSTAVSFLDCLFQWSFAATCTTVVSGAVADRIPVKAYLVYAFLTSALFYPLLAHAVWTDDGWASPAREYPLFGCGVIDFAGSGIVHMFGGAIGLFVSRKVRSRGGRFFPAKHWDGGANGSKLKNHTDQPQLNEAGFRSNDPAWMTLGTFLLWLGWYGFNCGSVSEISTTGSQNAAGRAALNTSIGAAWGCAFSMLFELGYHRWTPKYRRGDDIEDPLHLAPFDVDGGEEADRAERVRVAETHLSKKTLAKIAKHNAEHEKEVFTWPWSTHINLHGAACNGILAGLVGITAGCATMSPHAAIGVSFVSALLYHVSYRGFICLMIDDAVSAGAVHLVCGAWGVIAAGFTGMEGPRLDAGYPPQALCSRGAQVGTNFVMVAIITAYAYLCTFILWAILRGCRLVDQAEEGVVLAKGEDGKFTEFKNRVADQFTQENRRFKKVEEQLMNQNELGINSRATLDARFEQLANRMAELERTRGTTGTPTLGAPTSTTQSPIRPAVFIDSQESTETLRPHHQQQSVAASQPTATAQRGGMFEQVKRFFGSTA
ncbi:Ammonium transporter [Ectocarpus siliculosus]|uniref:Ammonium transporter n=1 Tax=Ectocarpus siliculosus TaxID=2880 RepID=D7G436_ECTSI|nr:Ammonium transporter [Ectocarpus siliculosus]|eukprot:CBJ33654.1 Ammonium transporter [Ectocarpus siliculosus]